MSVVDLCARLIAAPSENPPGDEEATAAVVAAWLDGAGYAVERHQVEPRRPNLVGRLRRGRGRRLILQAHMDTKPAAPPEVKRAWTIDPYLPRVRDGRLYGLGACDAKGGLAAQLTVARALAREGGWAGELMIQAVADEEDGSRLGAERLGELGLLTADGAVVAEPTGCVPSLAQLGNAWAEVVITGRAAHAGTPARGCDAFRAALRYVAEIDALLAMADRHPDFPGHPRLNVGDLLVAGHPGTVPGSCRLRCDIRVLPGQRHQDVFETYRRAAVVVRRELGLAVEVATYQGGGCQSHQIDPAHSLVRAFRRAPATTDRPNTAPFAGGTDARYFALAGTPAVVYGPGSLEQAHGPDEFVPLDDLHLAVRQLRAAVLGFLSPEPTDPSPEGTTPQP